MKNIIFALIIFSTTSHEIQAQDSTTSKSNRPLHLSFGLNGGKALGDNSKTSRFIIGGDLLASFSLSDNFKLTGSAGIDARLSNTGLVKTVYYAPMLGGLRFYFSDKIFVSEQAGYSLALTKGLDGVFTNQLGIGARLSPTADILLAYKSLFGKDGAQDFNSLALRIAYIFGR